MPLPRPRLRRRGAPAAGVAVLLLAAALGAPLAAPAAASTSGGWSAPVTARTTEVLTGRTGNGTRTSLPPVDRRARALSVAPGAATTHLTARSTGSVLSSWEIHYGSGFQHNAPARDAFQRAVDTWSRNVASPVPIVVDADLKTASDPAFTDPGVLGGAGPTTVSVNGGVAYPAALANALSGRDLRPADAAGDGADIEANFRDDSADTSKTFYYGSDPTQVPADEYDFESVVLHELGHGLGFIGSVDEDGNGTAYYGISDSDPTPLVFDLFTETGNGREILSYPNHSAALTGAITSANVYWDGPQGASADHGREPRLFAPSQFLSGSSYSHLSDTSYPKDDADALMTPYAEQADAIRDPGEVLLGMLRDMGWVTPGLTGGRFTPLSPTRVLDSGSAVPNGGVRELRVAGTSLVPGDATAVVLNLTAGAPTGPTYLTAYPAPRAEGAPLPAVSDLNAERSQDRANLTTVPVGAGGRIRIRNGGAATRIVADLAGWYSPAGDSAFHPVGPTRLLDTRLGTGAPRARVGAGGVVELQVRGAGGVPDTATAVTLTLTAVSPTAPTYVSASPSGTSTGTSSLNLARGAIAANSVIVQIGANGKVRLRNASGAVDLLADLAGWYDPGPGGALFRPTLPERALDTRPATLGPAAIHDLLVASPELGVPAEATAGVVNLTGVGPTRGTYLQAYATGSPVPGSSNLNLAAGQTAASLATVVLGGGRLRIRNAAGNLGLVVDVLGWFGPA